MPNVRPMRKLEIGEIVQKYEELRLLYSDRNDEMSIMREAHKGDFARTQVDRATVNGEFEDTRKLQYNMVWTAQRRYQDEMAANISVIGIPNGIEEDDLELAEARQKACERYLKKNNFDLKRAMAAYHQGLLGLAVFHARPAPEEEMKIKGDIVTPEDYFPVPSTSSWFDREAAMWSWRTFKTKSPYQQNVNMFSDGQAQLADQQDRKIEMWDKRYFVRLENIDGEWVRTVDIDHDLGLIPFDEVHNIPTPDQHRGFGDSDQILGLQRTLNEMFSDQADTLAYLANPIVVVRGSKMGSKELTWGPRAIWHLERDGAAELLSYAGNPPNFEAQILRAMQGIEDSQGVNSPALGREIPAGTSGSAITSVLGNFSSRTAAKQLYTGIALVQHLEKVQAIWEKLYPNEKLKIPGEGRGRKNDGTWVQPKEFKGHYDVQVVYQPQNETVRTFSEVQKFEKGLQSKRRTMKNLGVQNVQDEIDQIRLEREEDQEFERRQRVIDGGGDPGQGGFGQGGQVPRPFRRFQPTSAEQLAASVGSSDPGSLAEELGGNRNQVSNKSAAPVRFSDVSNEIDDLDFQGKVFLTGEIAEEGETAGPIEIEVENSADIEQVRRALGPLAGRAQIKLQDPGSEDKRRSVVGRPKRRSRRSR